MGVKEVIGWVVLGAVFGFAVGAGVAGESAKRRTPPQPDVRVVTFPAQNVECYVYRDTMQCFQYVDDGFPEGTAP